MTQFQTMSQAAPLDPQHALAVVDGDEELLQEIAYIFLMNYPAQLSALRQAVAANTTNSIRHTAHQLKGGLGNIGSKRAYQIAYAIELMGANNNLAGIDQQMNALSAELDRIAQFLAQPNWLTRLVAAASTTHD